MKMTQNRAKQAKSLDKFLDRPHIVNTVSAVPISLRLSGPDSLRPLEISERQIRSTMNAPYSQHVVRTVPLNSDIKGLRSSNLVASIGDYPAHQRRSEPTLFGSDHRLSAEEIWKSRLVVEFGSEHALEGVANSVDKTQTQTQTQGETAFLKTPSAFRCGAVQPSAVKSVSADFVKDGDKYLLCPSRRREILEEEVLASAARKAIGKAFAEKKRLQKIMETQYPRGVLGSEDATDPSSSVYGSRAQRLLGKEERLEFAVASRVVKPDLVSACLVDSLDGTEQGQHRLSRTAGKRSFPERMTGTNVLLGTGVEYRPAGTLRSERIAYQIHRGRQFDIISGADRPATTS
eukprot:ANDGO_06029.mRNA.1 hypothetical protein